MQNILLFTDGSVNTKTKVGFGAYLILLEPNFTDIKENIRVKKFTNTSSSKLELQILLFALNQLPPTKELIKVYTDSQNIIGLLEREKTLVENNYYSKSGKRLLNVDLYQQFYQMVHGLNMEFIKVKGHLKSGLKTDLDTIFTLVDRCARKALRAENLSVNAF